MNTLRDIHADRRWRGKVRRAAGKGRAEKFLFRNWGRSIPKTAGMSDSSTAGIITREAGALAELLVNRLWKKLFGAGRLSSRGRDGFRRLGCGSAGIAGGVWPDEHVDVKMTMARILKSRAFRCRWCAVAEGRKRSLRFAGRWLKADDGGGVCGMRCRR